MLWDPFALIFQPFSDKIEYVLSQVTANENAILRVTFDAYKPAKENHEKLS